MEEEAVERGEMEEGREGAGEVSSESGPEERERVLGLGSRFRGRGVKVFEVSG